jgi:hypothetical protein
MGVVVGVVVGVVMGVVVGVVVGDDGVVSGAGARRVGGGGGRASCGCTNPISRSISRNCPIT